MIRRSHTMNSFDIEIEGATLSGAIMRPEGLIPGRLSIDSDDTEQKRESARRLEKGMTFEVQNDVAPGASRERSESPPIFNRKLKISDLVGALSLELQGGLFVQRFECRGGDFRNPRRCGRLRQGGQRRDS